MSKKVSKKLADDALLKKLPFLAGLCCTVFTIFCVISCVSFAFTWQQDQSLLCAPDYFPEFMQATNAGGGSGYYFGHFLVGNCFGIGSVVILGVLCLISVKLISGGKVDWKRALISGFAGSFAVGLVFAYFGKIFSKGGSDVVFGGGIGGAACSFLVTSMTTLFGFIVTLFVLMLLLFAVIYLSLPEKTAYAQSRKTDAGTKVAAEDEADVDDEDVNENEDDVEEFVKVEDVVDVVEDSAVEENPLAPEGLAAESESAGQDIEVVQDDADGQEGGETGTEIVVNGPDETLSTQIDQELPPLDIKSDLDRYHMPSLELLHDYADKRFVLPDEEIRRNVDKIKTTLESFKIPIVGVSASVGYTVTLYKISLGEGVRVNSVKNLEDDIAIKIGIKGVRVVMLADAVGIEVPNEKASVVPLKAILNSDSFRKCEEKGELPIALGYTITTKAKVFDLADAPHLLVAGATKQGKSVGLNAIITSLLYSKHPTELKLVFIDPKMVEFQKYSKLYKHYLAVLPQNVDDDQEADNAIVKDAKNAEAVLRSLCVEMDERYKLLAAGGVNKITAYNDKFRARHLNPNNGHHFMPYIVLIVDEYADLTKASFGTDKNISRSIENSINRLAAKGRAAGLHVIIATQRPSVDVITGTIKGNFPTRMAFRTVQKQDSQTILGMTGAEKLIGKGDMLFFTGADAERVQCALVESDEIDELTSYIASQKGFKQSFSQPYYLPDPGDPEGGEEGGNGGLVDVSRLDELFEDAAKLAVMNQGLSTSMLQRKMQLGFARAGRIMDQLEATGVVGPQQGAKPREALIMDLATLQTEVFDRFIK